MKANYVTLSLALFGVVYCAESLGQAVESPREIYDEAKKSTFVIETFDAKGIPLSLGTGFAVRSNWLASNCHVIRGAHRVSAKSLDSDRSFHVEAIVGSDLRADLVLLRIGGSATPLVMDTNLSWSVGDSVYALGNPRGLAGTFSAGIISAMREVDNVHYLQITAPISPGSSGGPILSSGSKVIGVATSAIKESQNLNFAVSARHLAALLTAEQREDSFGSFFAKQVAFVREQDSAHKANEANIVIRDFEWTPGLVLGDDRPFSFTVFNGLSRPVCKVLVVVSLLNTNLEPVDTKFLPVVGTIGPQSALRAKASVDDSVYRLNQLRDPQYADFDHETVNEFVHKFTLGANSVTVKWKGAYTKGFKPSYSINGKSATKADYDRLWAEAQPKMRVMRVLNFEYAD